MCPTFYCWFSAERLFQWFMKIKKVSKSLINQGLFACLFDSNCNSNGHTNHGVVTCFNCTKNQTFFDTYNHSNKPYFFAFYRWSNTSRHYDWFMHNPQNLFGCRQNVDVLSFFIPSKSLQIVIFKDLLFFYFLLSWRISVNMLWVNAVEIAVVFISHLHCRYGAGCSVVNQLACESKLFLQNILLWGDIHLLLE